MANKFKFETREERIDRAMRDNPGRPIELCAAVADGIWDKKRKAIMDRIPERFTDATMADLGYMTKPILDAVDSMFEPPKANDVVGLIFSGIAGSGKTHAAYAVIKMIAEKNPEMIAYMAWYSQVMQELRHEFTSNSYDELGSMWDKINNDSGMYPGLLFLDDVSALKPTDFEVDKLIMAIDKRVNEYLPFILTTNILPDRFREVFGERLASRLLGYCKIIEFEERDQRIEKTVKPN